MQNLSFVKNWNLTIEPYEQIKSYWLARHNIVSCIYQNTKTYKFGVKGLKVTNNRWKELFSLKDPFEERGAHVAEASSSPEGDKFFFFSDQNEIFMLYQLHGKEYWVDLFKEAGEKPSVEITHSEFTQSLGWDEQRNILYVHSEPSPIMFKITGIEEGNVKVTMQSFAQAFELEGDDLLFSGYLCISIQEYEGKTHLVLFTITRESTFSALIHVYQLKDNFTNDKGFPQFVFVDGIDTHEVMENLDPDYVPFGWILDNLCVTPKSKRICFSFGKKVNQELTTKALQMGAVRNDEDKDKDEEKDKDEDDPDDFDSQYISKLVLFKLENSKLIPDRIFKFRVDYTSSLASGGWNIFVTCSKDESKFYLCFPGLFKYILVLKTSDYSKEKEAIVERVLKTMPKVTDKDLEAVEGAARERMEYNRYRRWMREHRKPQKINIMETDLRPRGLGVFGSTKPRRGREIMIYDLKNDKKVTAHLEKRAGIQRKEKKRKMIKKMKQMKKKKQIKEAKGDEFKQMKLEVREHWGKQVVLKTLFNEEKTTVRLEIFDLERPRAVSRLEVKIDCDLVYKGVYGIKSGYYTLTFDQVKYNDSRDKANPEPEFIISKNFKYAYLTGLGVHTRNKLTDPKTLTPFGAILVFKTQSTELPKPGEAVAEDKPGVRKEVKKSIYYEQVSDQPFFYRGRHRLIKFFTEYEQPLFLTTYDKERVLLYGIDLPRAQATSGQVLPEGEGGTPRGSGRPDKQPQRASLPSERAEKEAPKEKKKVTEGRAVLPKRRKKWVML